MPPRLREALAWSVRPASLLPVVVVAGLVAAIYLPLTPAYDFEVYRRAGDAWWHHRAVYPAIGSPDVFSGSAFVYPFVSLWPYIALAELPTGLAMAMSFIVTTAAIILAARAAGVRTWPHLTVVLLSAFVITGLQLGNLTPWLLVGALLMWRLRDRPWLFGLVAGPVVASKLVLVPLLAWPLIARRWKAFGVAVAATLGMLGLSFLTGPIGARDYLRLLGALGDHEAAQGIGLITALRRIGLASAPAEAIALVVAVAVLAAVWWRFRTVGDETTVYAGAVVAALLATPVLWSHYLALLAAPLVVRRTSLPALAAFAAGTWALAPPHGATWWSVVAALAVVAACAWRGIASRVRVLLTPTVAVGAAVVVGTTVGLLVGLAGNPRLAALGVSAWLGVGFAVAVLVASSRAPRGPLVAGGMAGGMGGAAMGGGAMGGGAAPRVSPGPPLA